jgi:hypothetical protein
VDLKAGGTQKRYTCDGAFDASEQRGDVINGILSSMAGMCVPPGNAWRMYAGAWRTPVFELTDDDLRGPIKMDTKVSRRDLANTITGVYVSPDNNWQPSDFPPYQDADALADDGEYIATDIQLGFTTNGIRAQRLAKIKLEKIRRQKTLVLACKLKALELQPGDTCEFTHDRFGFDAKTFEVLQTSLVQDNSSDNKSTVVGVDLVLKEADSDIYAWDATTDENEVVVPSPSLLPDITTVGAPSDLACESGSTVALVRSDGIRHTRIEVAWTAPTDTHVLSGGRINVYVADNSLGNWRLAAVAAGDDTVAYINDVTDGNVYDVKINAVNSAGAESLFVEVDGITASDDSATFAGTVSSLDNVNDGTTYVRNAGQFGQNLLENPSFEVPALAGSGDVVAGWFEAGQQGLLHSTVQNASFAFSGNACYEVNLSGTAALANGASWTTTIRNRKAIPVYPGQKLTLRGYVKATVSGLPSGVTCRSFIQVRQFYSDGSADFSALLFTGDLSANTSWTPISVGPCTMPTPVGKTIVSVSYEMQIQVVNASGSSQTLSSSTMNAGAFFDNVELIRVSDLDSEIVDGTTFRRLANVNADNTLHVSTPLNKQGSLVSFPKNAFSYTSTTTSITWSWTAFSIYLPDGTSISVPSGSAAAFTGLSASHTYHFGIYVTVSGPTVHIDKSTQSSGTAKETLSIIVGTFQGDGNVAVNIDAQASTPASGSGGGGGGADSCFSPNTKIKTKRGDVAIVDVVPGDLVLTARGTWCEVETVTSRNYDGEALNMGNEEIVTPRHEFRTADGWKHVGDLCRYPWVWYTGTIHNLHLKTQDDPTAEDTEHSYTLCNGVQAHNFNPT